MPRVGQVGAQRLPDDPTTPAVKAGLMAAIGRNDQ